MNAIPVDEGMIVGAAQVATAPAGSAPRRSWSKSKPGENTFDFKFEYEGATVFCRNLSAADWDGILASQKELTEKAEEVTAHAKALEDAQKSGKTSKEELKRLESENLTKAEGAAELADAYHLGIVRKAVLFWEDAPIPYSADAANDLPSEITREWVQQIIQKSPPLTRKESGFFTSQLNRFIHDRPLSWDENIGLKSFFDAFLCSGGRFTPDELSGHSSRFQMAMTILCGERMRLEMRGAIGAASMVKWQK